MIKPIMGTMTFGQQVNIDLAEEMMKMFLQSQNTEIDTAYVYNEGDSEKILGNLLKEYNRESYQIATKVNPRITGKLDEEAVYTQFYESLRRMNVDYVDILYLHFPDPNTPIEIALKACDKLYKEGRIKELGFSNFPAWLVVDAYYRCKENGWILPTVYQGMYNALNRNAESELFTALRCFGIRYYAYNPLAGGILSGKYVDFNEKPETGRFACRVNYKNRYWKESYFEALKELKKACDNENISVVEAVLRWMSNHSALDGKYGDGILIGASKLSQLEQNLSYLNGKPLSDRLLQVFEELWLKTKHDSEEYFRYYTPNK